MNENQEVVEHVDTQLTNHFDFNELGSLHIAALRGIKNKRIDQINVSDKMQDVIFELIHNELVDNKYKLTAAGDKAIELAIILGGSRERQRAAAQKNVDIDDIYGEDPEKITDYDTDDDINISPYAMGLSKF